MRLVADSGLWTTGRADVTEEPPLVALLEVSGAVLSWTLDDPDDAPPRLTFTDVSRADWLWRVLGEAGHVALVSAVRDAAVPAGGIELAGVDVAPSALAPLRRLATGHWLRRWWPASRQDGIAGLDRALLDAELALLTAGAQHFFPDDTLDSDVAGLLAPHATALLGHLVSPDPRVADLVRASAGLADGIGVDAGRWPELLAALDDSSLVVAPPSDRRDDYALAAGARPGPRGGHRPRRRIRRLVGGAARCLRCGRGHRRLEHPGRRFGRRRRRAGRRHRTGPGHRDRGAAALGRRRGCGPLDAAGRATFLLTGARGH